MEKQFVKDLKIGDTVHCDFVVTEKALVPFTQPNRAGEQFLRMQLSDRTGSLRAVAWDHGAQLGALFQVGDVVRIRGEVGNYHGPQLVVAGLTVVSADAIQKDHFQRVAPRDKAEMIAELTSVLDMITEPSLARLMDSFFGDALFLKAYIEAPAARSVHHNYVGGLLEHSLEVASLCRHFVVFHPELNRSLLLCGAILHDVGKIDEYETTGLTIELTTRGKLLGHIMMGLEMITQKVQELQDIPRDLHLELAHMILSHHGQKEWGSPEIPKTFTAFALFHADLVSARLNQFKLVSTKGAKVDGWTDWDRTLERDIFLGLAE